MSTNGPELKIPGDSASLRLERRAHVSRLVILLLFTLLIGCAAGSNGAGRRSPIEEIASDEWQMPSGGCRLYVREIGSGPRVVVLHGGWGAEHSYMVEGLAPLADRYRLTFYDQRGSLRSQCDSNVTVDAHVEDLERLRLALGEEKLVLLAHSMGGYLAMAYAQRYPERVAGLALIGSAPARGTQQQLTADLNEPALARWSRAEVIAELERNGVPSEKRSSFTPMQRGIWHRITFAAINLHDVRRWRELRGTMYYSAAAGSAAALSSPQSWDFTGALASLPFPVLVMHGDDDYIPLALQRAWLPSVPNARLAVIRDAGHVVWIDQPEEFHRALAPYLAEILGGR